MSNSALPARRAPPLIPNVKDLHSVPNERKPYIFPRPSYSRQYRDWRGESSYWRCWALTNLFAPQVRVGMNVGSLGATVFGFTRGRALFAVSRPYFLAGRSIAERRAWRRWCSS